MSSKQKKHTFQRAILCYFLNYENEKAFTLLSFYCASADFRILHVSIISFQSSSSSSLLREIWIVELFTFSMRYSDSPHRFLSHTINRTVCVRTALLRVRGRVRLSLHLLWWLMFLMDRLFHLVRDQSNGIFGFLRITAPNIFQLLITNSLDKIKTVIGDVHITLWR